MNFYKSGEIIEIGDRVKLVKFLTNKQTDEFGLRCSIMKGSLGIVVDVLYKALVKIKCDNYPNDTYISYIHDLIFIKRTNLKAFL